MNRKKIVIWNIVLIVLLFMPIKTKALEEYKFDYTGDYQEFIVPSNGYYKLETWGAQGGRNTSDSASHNYDGGKGAYAKGTIFLLKGTKLYIYVGGKGTDGQANSIVMGGYNGGGTGDHDHNDDEAAGAGGGATDIRIVSGPWNDFNSLKSRIMVAAGGGGSAYGLAGGYGGALTGGNTTYSNGGTQTTGYKFGIGMDGILVDYNTEVGGASGGYYGGFANTSGSGIYMAAGAGGSSFVSGCIGCDAINENSTVDNIMHTNQPNHYSKLVFKDITMIDGNASMPNHDGNGSITGNAGNGCAKITKLESGDAIANISLDDAIVLINNDYNFYEYTAYIKPIHPATATFNLDIYGNPVSITGYENVALNEGDTVEITLTTTTGEVLIYTVDIQIQKAHLDDLQFDYAHIDFNVFNYEYDITVPYNIKKLTPFIKVRDGVTYEIDNPTLKVGENTITITVHENGYDEEQYVIKVIRSDYQEVTTPETNDFKYTGDYQTFVVPKTGIYQIEAWGASGGNALTGGKPSKSGGAGAYTSGQIFLKKGQVLYIYVGGKGVNGKVGNVVPGGYNGGGTGDYDHSDDEAGGAGGGATDIRLIKGNWNDFNSLKSRIMVAAGGGGGADGSTGYGGYGGALTGGNTTYSKGGTQTTGYAFGMGMDGKYSISNIDMGGGGSGYYGGFSIANKNYSSSGAGGSSFVSGCNGCDAILETSTSDNILHSGTSEHYSGYVFENIVMKAGNEVMPSYTDDSTMTGNSNNGYARITLVEGLAEFIDIDIENATIVEPIDSLTTTYHVLIPNDNFETKLTAVTNKKATIIGDKNITLKEGKIHYLIAIDESGNLSIVNIIPTIKKPTLDNIIFEETTFTYSPNLVNYSLKVPNGIKKLTPKITKKDNITYTIEGNLNLSVGNNVIKIVVQDELNTTNTYTFNVYREYQKISESFEYSGKTETFVVPQTGIYRIQAWGAGGGRNLGEGSYTTANSFAGGKGAYTKGEVYLEEGTILYINVGGKGSDAIVGKVVPGGYNGGGTGDWDHTDNEAAAAGGGATDIRLVGGDWNDFDSLKSRIMVAAGGGGAAYGLAGGYGGALTGQDTLYSKGGTQTSGYAFGIGMNGKYTNSNVDVGGAGSGYYGGYANSSGASSKYQTAGAGGSSFVSGCVGCNAIDESSTSTNIIHTNQSEHYSGYVFENIVMKAGNEAMPSYTNNDSITGNAGNGYLKIEFVPDNETKLTSLTTSKGTMNPNFDSNVYKYTVELDNIDTIVKVDAETNNPEALIEGNIELTIPVGETTHNVTVTDEAGSVKIYELTFKREANNYKFLEGILVNGIPIADFSSQKFEYDIEIPYYLDIVNIEAIKHNDFQTVKETGIYDFTDDSLTKVLFVISEDGTQNQTYKLNLNRQKTSLLKELTTGLPGVNIDFKEDINEYELEVNKNVLAIDFKAIPYYKSAEVTITGNKFIENGDVITITSHVDGVADTVYKIKIKHTNEASYEQSYGCTLEPVQFVAPYSGYYSVKLWGAAGGRGMSDGVMKYIGGEGSYTSGTILLKQGETIYVYVGCKGSDAGTNGKWGGGLGGYNGGANGGNDNNKDSSPEPGSGGGGATDIRLVGGAWNDAASLNSRLMVAAGASGGSYYYVGVPGGGLQGYKPSSSNSIATQIGGYAKGFGQVGNNSSAGSSGAGGGYYGGYNLPVGNSSYISGGSGSSYISGHIGSIGTKEDGSPNVTTYTTITDSYNYSGKYFIDTKMIDGSGYNWTSVKDKLELMPNPKGGYFASGHGNDGDGYAEIKLLTVLSSNNYLDSITLNDGDIEIDFEPWTQEYDVYLLENETTLKVDAIAKDDKATIQGLGEYKIKPFDSILPITVTSSDGSIRVYNINVYREPSSDSTPIDIKINKMTPYICSIGDDYCNYNFDVATTNYNILVPFAINKIELLAVPRSDYQQVIYRKWNGTEFVEIENGQVNLTSGINKFEIEIISEDEANNTIYTYNITRDPNGNTNVTDIKVTNPEIAIEYNPLIYEYTINVNAKDSQVEFDVTPELETATVKINGNKNLGQGMNDCYIVITAPNGETKTYIFHIYKEQDSNVLLSTLEVSNGTDNYTLTPVFNKYVNDYTLNVDSSILDVNINAIAESSSAQVQIQKNSPLVSGLNEIKIIVTNGENDSNVYNLNIIKQKGSNPNLANIEAKGYPLDQPFNKDITEYYLTVPKDVNKLDLTIIPEEATTKYTVRGNNLIKNNNEIVITSIAENKTRKVYYLHVTKDISNNNDLSDIILSEGTLDPTFNKDTLEYNVSVPSTVDRINVEGILADSNATIKGNGDYALIPGENTINLVVTSELGDEKTYTIKVNKGRSEDVTLKEVKNDQNSIVTNITDETLGYDYLINVQYDVKRIYIEGIPNDSKAIVLGNGYYDLTTGSNIIGLTVTSESGDIRYYNVNVQRDLSHNDDLAYLFAKEGALNPTFKDTTIFYDIYVDNDVTSLTIEAIPEDARASVDIIDNENFTVGENKVIVRVTAESGNTKDYTLNVIRQEAETSNLLLSDLEVTGFEITPDFSSFTYLYNLTVPYDTTSVNVIGTAVDDTHRVLGNGTYNLNVGKNAVGIGVVNMDGVRKDYQVVITREKSPIATLDNLIVKGHTLSPSFNKNTYQYTINTSSSYLDFTSIIPTESEATYKIVGNSDFVSGENTVTITVTAPDGVTTKDYILTVNRSASKNNNLASLEVSGETLVPTFHKGITFYTVDVNSDINSLVIKATPEDKAATVTGDGLVQIKSGVNEFVITVTSEANTTKKYTVIITRDGSDNNYLSSLLTSEGNLEFNKETLTYELTVPYEIDEIILAGDTEVSSSTVKGFGTYSLSVGKNVIPITVTSETGLDRVYTVTVTRSELISSKLANLEVEGYELDSEFDSDYYEYYINVPNEVFSVNITATPLESKAKVTIEGNENFTIGMNDVTITVTSSDESETTVYHLYVNRQLSTNNKLLYLSVDKGTLNPIFNKDTTLYNVTVDNEVTEITVSGEAEDSNAKIISGLGTHSLKTGENKIFVKVRSMTGIERTYTIIVERTKSNNNDLKKLEILNGTDVLPLNPIFNKDTTIYSLNVDSSIKFIDIKALAFDDNATIIGSGVKELTLELNSFDIVVTAENGTTKTYTINVTRTKSSDNKVINITPSVGTFTESFDPSVKEYTLTVTDSDQFLSFDVELSDKLSTVTGHENTILPNENSTRTITITAENGATNIYTINIVRESLAEARLETLKIEGYEFEFNPDTFSYNISVSQSKEILKVSEITAIAKDSEATVNLMGDLPLSKDIVNIYTVEVIAKDGYTVQEYKLNITRDSTIYSLINNTFNIKRDEGYIVGMEARYKLEDFIQTFENDSEMIKFYDKDDNVITDLTKITSTKMTVKLEKDDYVYDYLRIIVLGDINGDGLINVADKTLINNHILQIKMLTGDEFIAGNLNFDNVLNVGDKTIINNYILQIIPSVNKKAQ